MTKTVRNGITINMDKNRTFRFTHKARAYFEDAALPIIGQDRNPNANILQVLTFYWQRAKIQTLAIMAALLHEESLTEDQASDLIDAYTDKGGSIDELGLAIQEACRMAFDPSGLESWKASLKILRKTAENQQKAMEIEQAANLEKSEKKLMSLTSPGKPTVLESSA